MAFSVLLLIDSCNLVTNLTNLTNLSSSDTLGCGCEAAS